MGASKKSLNLFKYRLNGSLKKNGINVWKYVFTAVEKGTGNEKMFFVELTMLNPYLSPSETVLGFQPRNNVSPEQLQNVLAGTESARTISTENLVIPSYASVKAGFLGAGAKQISCYAPIRDLKSSSHGFELEIEKCFFSEDRLTGILSQNASEVREHPEYFSDAGMISWDLRFDIKHDFAEGYKTKNCVWAPVGNKTVFAGNISIDGREYSVLPKSSFGYIDRNFGSTLPYPWFHLSCSHLTSVITGKLLEDSSFSIHGSYKNRLSIVSKLENNTIVFSASSSKRSYSMIWDCSNVQETDENEKLHWSVSAHNKKYVMDVDVFAVAKDLFVRTIELPEGMRKTLQLVTGCSVSGEIRLYKKIKKNLELIEHAHIANALCEFGQMEMPEL